MTKPPPRAFQPLDDDPSPSPPSSPPKPSPLPPAPPPRPAPPCGANLLFSLLHHLVHATLSRLRRVRRGARSLLRRRATRVLRRGSLRLRRFQFIRHVARPSHRLARRRGRVRGGNPAARRRRRRRRRRLGDTNRQTRGNIRRRATNDTTRRKARRTTRRRRANRRTRRRERLARNPVEGRPVEGIPVEGIRADRVRFLARQYRRGRTRRRDAQTLDASVARRVRPRRHSAGGLRRGRRVSVHRRLPVTVDVRERAYECHLSERRCFASVSCPRERVDALARRVLTSDARY